MTAIVFAISILIVILGVLGIISPILFAGFVRRFDNLNGLYFAAAFRILFGAALLYIAPAAYWPHFIRIFGALALIAGLSMLFIGLERFHKIVGWWCKQSPLHIRLWAVSAVLLGSLLAYAVCSFR